MRSSNGRTDGETATVLAVRVTNRADKPLGEVVPGVRRAIYFDAPEGSAQLSFGAAEVDPGKSIPVHRHKVADRYVEEAFFVLDGEGEVRVGDETRPIRAGSFCVMSPAEGFHTIRNTGATTLRFVMCFAGTGVQMERKA
ncbi:MAG: cupin domain-containing protein [Chloroflexi bacterium]|nr:MAG: cupin domain-containing protein [Chloroflexota bacterium]